MVADHALGLVEAEQPHDTCAEIIGVGAEPIVAERAHQFGANPPGLPILEPRPTGPVAEAMARQRGHDDVKRVTRIATVRTGIGEQGGQIQHLVERARPPMHQQQRYRRGTNAWLVNRVDIQSIHLKTVVLETIDASLDCSPIEAAAPVGHEVAHECERGAVVPAALSDLIGPDDPVQAKMEIF